MDNPSSSNGHHPYSDEHEPVNAYADAVLGSRPREIADFELGTDPYANVVPTALRQQSAVGVDLTADGGEKDGRNPLFVAISVLLIVLLVLPPLVVVFARLGL